MEPETLTAIIAGSIGAVYTVGKGIETMHSYYNAKQKYKQLPLQDQENISRPTLKNTINYILQTSFPENPSAGFNAYKNSIIGQIDAAYEGKRTSA
ncbi:hypothetical protein K9M74_00345 [Candidatus Woesearchaeota archaeon]|nr:hypothetical protein [Candidatus Woesearchaeota archaeon]